MSKYLKREERKKQIKEAAMELFKTKGYKYASVKDIVDMANTSKGVFYHCYSSKMELFKEIIDDGCIYRHNQMINYKNENSQLDKKTLLVEMLLDKIISYNKYKKLYSMLLMEMGKDEILLGYYQDGSKIAQQNFIEFCKNEGFEECVDLNSKEYEAFINSLILGVDLFNLYESENYKDILRTIITAYFEKIGLFNS